MVNKKNEKPILFTEKMVNAILENKKFVTRRLVRPQPPEYVDWLEYKASSNSFRGYMQPGEPTVHFTKAKYWPDLILWVKETWGITVFWCTSEAYNPKMKKEKLISVKYKANNFENHFVDVGEKLYEKYFVNSVWNNEGLILKWRPSLFIPRAASRILLKVINVSIERLHETDDTEARLEGCKNRDEYIKVWNKINTINDYSWEKNPFVYRIEFIRLIDVN